MVFCFYGAYLLSPLVRSCWLACLVYLVIGLLAYSIAYFLAYSLAYLRAFAPFLCSLAYVITCLHYYLRTLLLAYLFPHMITFSLYVPTCHADVETKALQSHLRA